MKQKLFIISVELLVFLACLVNGCDSPSCHIETFTGKHEGLSCLACSPDGQFVVTGSAGAPRDCVKIWDVSRKKMVKEITLEKLKAVASIAYSPLGTMVAFDGGSGVRILRAKTWEEILHIKIDSANIIAFSPDGKKLVVGCALGRVQLRDVTTGEMLKKFKTDEPEVISAMAVSPVGSILAVGTHHGNIYLWDMGAEEKIAVIKVPCRCWTLAFSPDGKNLACSGEDGVIRLWDMATRKETSWEGDPLTIPVVVFTSNNILVACGFDRTVNFWDTSKQKLLLKCTADPYASVGCVASCPAIRKLLLGSGRGVIMLLTPPKEIWQ